MQLPAPSLSVQCLDIYQSMVEAIAMEIDFVFCDRVEHERIVRIRRMTELKHVAVILCHLEFVIRDRSHFLVATQSTVQIYAVPSERDEFRSSSVSANRPAEPRL